MSANERARLTPEQSAQLAVDGSVGLSGQIVVEASTDPADIAVMDYLHIQGLHLSGDEAGLMRAVQSLHRGAYEAGCLAGKTGGGS